MEPILVVIAVISVPWMLFIKPFYLRSQAKKRSAELGVTFSKLEESASTHNINDDPDTINASGHSVTHSDDFPLHQDKDSEPVFEFSEVCFFQIYYRGFFWEENTYTMHLDRRTFVCAHAHVHAPPPGTRH